jgi:phosphoribosylglycinamide formyltransferase-1
VLSEDRALPDGLERRSQNLYGENRELKEVVAEITFENRVLNIHPALLPAFPGVDSWKQALDHGVKIAGCTVHVVDAGIDSGPILVQRAVPVLADDTPETLHARIQVEEHKAYPEALRLVAARIRGS